MSTSIFPTSFRVKTMPMIEIAASNDVQDSRLLAVKANGTPVLLTRVDGQPRAILNKCPHMGMPLAKGTVRDGVVTCPWHGAKFDVCSGQNVEWCNAFAGVPLPKWSHRLVALGKDPQPVTVFETREENGKVFVRVPG